jgi:hypothetical protein
MLWHAFLFLLLRHMGFSCLLLQTWWFPMPFLRKPTLRKLAEFSSGKLFEGERKHIPAELIEI